jgi:hypothetical protein
MLAERLRTFFLFAKLQPDELEHVVAALFPRDTVPGEVVIRQGDEGDYFYVVERGLFDVFVEGVRTPTPITTTTAATASPPPHTHTSARTHTCTHAQARAHTHTHARTHTHVLRRCTWQNTRGQGCLASLHCCTIAREQPQSCHTGTAACGALTGNSSVSAGTHVRPHAHAQTFINNTHRITHTLTRMHTWSFTRPCIDVMHSLSLHIDT